MLAFQALFDILPSLALLAAGLSAIESTPGALAHSRSANRGVGHQHLVARHKVASSISKRGPQSGAGIRKRADGTVCRARKGATLASSIASIVPSSTPSSAPSSQAPAPSSAWVESTESTAVAIAIATSASTPQSSEAPQASVSQKQESTYVGGGSGWTNHGSKLGAAWPNGDWAQPNDPNYIANYIGQRTSWYYTWNPSSCPNADKLGLEFVPMLHNPSMVGDFWAQQSSWPSTVKNALFFNEPNHENQANVSPQDSVQYWINDMVPLRARGISLGGAAPTNAPSGIQWVKDALTACVNYGNSKADCTPDFYPVHWYDTSAQGFIDYVEMFHRETGLDLWVTEYACQNFNGGAQCDEGQVWNLHQTMSDWFDKTDYVKRYSPFGVMKNMQDVNQMNALMNPDGTISSLGSWYIGSA